MNKTTQEYHQLVEENERLIYGFCKKYGLPPDEVYDILAIALCKAAKNYDPEYGFSFSSFAYQVMGNAMKGIHEKKVRNNPNEIRTVNFEDIMPASWDDGGDAPNALEILSTGEDFTSDIDFRIDSECFLKRLTDKEKRVLSLVLEGCPTTEIAKIIGTSRQNVSCYLRIIRFKYTVSMDYKDTQTSGNRRRYT